LVLGAFLEMDPRRFQQIVAQYPSLRVAIAGDFCLDRYLEIDPGKQETSLETGLPVYNVVNVRAQAGGAGTILNNLAALGIGTIYPVGFAGEDGEGLELWRALENQKGVKMNYFFKTAHRRTFTYCKPLIVAPNKAPVELNRLDTKNWTATPASVQDAIAGRISEAAGSADAVIVLDQVDIPETGVVTKRTLETVRGLGASHRNPVIVADSRRGLSGYPPVIFKMNVTELCALSGVKNAPGLQQIKELAAGLAVANKRNVYVTLSERGILGACPYGEVEHVAALPIRGEIDIVGAGDAVTANLTAALAAGASLREALEIANAAASVVIHKLGTTGTATVGEIEELLRRV
jgi:rfaE bifunctional protein kinase chain/domain